MAGNTAGNWEKWEACCVTGQMSWREGELQELLRGLF